MAFTFFLANAGAMISAYISLVVRLARLEVKVENHERDIDGIGGNFRKLETEFKNKGE